MTMSTYDSWFEVCASIDKYREYLELPEMATLQVSMNAASLAALDVVEVLNRMASGVIGRIVFQSALLQDDVFRIECIDPLYQGLPGGEFHLVEDQG